MATIDVCVTCRRREGEKFADLVRQAANEADQPVQVRDHECLWACSMGCNVLIQARDKYGYLLGGYRGDDHAAAEAVVQYAIKQKQSADGVVDFRDWPAEVKGHFIARIPPQ